VPGPGRGRKVGPGREVGRARKVALTIAGLDSGGGAGVVADLKTFEAHGVWGTVALTAVTAQNSVGIQRVEILAPAMVRAQLDSVLGDLRPDALKTGMLGDAAVVATVAEALAGGGPPLVVDPVLVATSGRRLLDEAGVDAVRTLLLPRATVVTPNLAEAGVLTGIEVAGRNEMVAAARALVRLGSAAALVTGGHLSGDVIADCLVVGTAQPRWFDGPRLPGGSTHGTGCVLSAAVAARLAAGASIGEACALGIAFVRAAIAGRVMLGSGDGAADPAAWRAGPEGGT
jgi:hydroxymethylpyrimidine kinase/phosphomethylpyrimidine kinase